MGIQATLATIQQGLKAPKGQFNKFGGYYYRSCEDILEAAKPILADKGAVVTLSDDLIMLGDRHYVKATASLSAEGENITVTAYAREEAVKKGMDGSQITGAASSYARKYALNGLFLIDDNKDSDSTNDHGKGDKKPERTPEPPVSAPVENDVPGEKLALPGQITQIQMILKRRGITDRKAALDDYEGFLGRRVQSSKEFTFDEATEYIAAHLPKHEDTKDAA